MDEKIFIYQRDDFSCGPACLATVALIYGKKDKDYDFFRDTLTPDPKIGSCNMQLAAAAAAHLGALAHGEGIYEGGVAVANIIHPPSREGHYVVMLDKKDDEIIYYDPYDHEIHIRKEQDIEWVSESGHLKNWAVVFPPVEDSGFDRWAGLRDKVKKLPKLIRQSPKP